MFDDRTMKKTLTVLASVLIIATLAMAVGASAIAYLTDTETVGQNVFTAGTLDLTVNNENPCTVDIAVDDIAPGWSEMHQFWLKNIGTLDGKLSIEFSVMVNDDNGLTEPEEADGDSTGGAGEGELGEYLKASGVIQDIDGTTKTVFGSQPLNNIGGNTYTLSGKYEIIGAGEEAKPFKFNVQLPVSVGNIIQSDSVEFSIMFHLEQA